MITLEQLAPIVGAAKHDIENWVRKARSGTIQLHSQFAATTRGQSRLYSRQNALELAFMAAFVEAGFPPATCAAIAASYARQCQVGQIQEWLLLGADLRTGLKSDTLTGGKIKEFAKQHGAHVVHVVNVGDIKRRVEASFEE